jgi:DNA replication protein DnaC
MMAIEGAIVTIDAMGCQRDIAQKILNKKHDHVHAQNTPEQARDLFEIVEDRYDAGSIVLTSQVPVDRWHDIVGNPTLADAILDRIVYNAYRIELAGESISA